MDIEGYHRYLLSRNKNGGTKLAIVKSVNKNHSKDMLRLKKIISSYSKVFICALTIAIFGASVKICSEDVSSIKFSVLVQMLL